VVKTRSIDDSQYGPYNHSNTPRECHPCAEVNVKYEGFIKRQEGQVAKVAGKMNKAIPPGVDYHAITTLRMEVGLSLPGCQIGYRTWTTLAVISY
jgi:tRNA U34 5-carboxymethylaminomethyl modifying enzyme MnmG/GidA